jgi:hypothetical protein
MKQIANGVEVTTINQHPHVAFSPIRLGQSAQSDSHLSESRLSAARFTYTARFPRAKSSLSLFPFPYHPSHPTLLVPSKHRHPRLSPRQITQVDQSRK